MQSRCKHRLIGAIVATCLLSLWGESASAENTVVSRNASDRSFVIGPKLRAGGRFDNVRMCVASPAGAKGGPAADISLSVEIELTDALRLDIDIPVFRPLLFGAAFQMLQFEPSVTFKFPIPLNSKIDFVAGPVIGLSFHYGPDYNSEMSGDKKTASFFAMGPMLGGYAGLDFKRPGKTYNFQLGLTPYAEPLFGINDSADHRGVAAGALLDFQFRFGKAASVR